MEAFATAVPLERWRAASGAARHGQPAHAAGFLRAIQAGLESGELHQPTRRPLWSQRHGVDRAPRVLTTEQLRAEFARVATDLRSRGYFGRDAASECPDDDSGRTLGALLLDELGFEVLPFVERVPELDDGAFYDLVELLHDHAARPRRTYWHGFYGHDDYSDYAAVPGQSVYRWQVNDLFERSVVDLVLADCGEDCGRLVTPSSDARNELIRACVQHQPSNDKM